MTENFGLEQNWQTTRWSMVLNAKHATDQNPDSNDADELWHASLQALCQLYWYPLYVFLRRKGYAPDDCQDLTQDFFASLIEKDFLKVVDPKKGRFRWFLMHAIGKFAASWNTAQAAQKRGGGKKFFSLEFDDGENRYKMEPSNSQTPESLFERQWAMTILETAITELKQAYHDDGKSRFFDALQVFISPGSIAPNYADVALELGVTETAIKVAIHRLRQKYKKTLRRVVLETLDDPSELDDEIDALMMALG